jgi:hypothetical protein
MDIIDAAPTRRFHRRANITMGLRLDEWTVDWISMVGEEGVTNYTHLMTYDHIVHYLNYWRNLYRYRNQGREQFNSKYRYIYCHRKKKGGSFLHTHRIWVKNEANWLVVFAT